MVGIAPEQREGVIPMVPKRWIGSTVLVWLLFVNVAAAQEVQTTERAIPGQYIVVLKDDQTARGNVRPVVGDLARQSGARVTHVFENTIRGFAASMSATTRQRWHVTRECATSN